jgi:hypothetical protein
MMPPPLLASSSATGSGLKDSRAGGRSNTLRPIPEGDAFAHTNCMARV